MLVGDCIKAWTLSEVLNVNFDEMCEALGLSHSDAYRAGATNKVYFELSLKNIKLLQMSYGLEDLFNACFSEKEQGVILHELEVWDKPGRDAYLEYRRKSPARVTPAFWKKHNAYHARKERKFAELFYKYIARRKRKPAELFYKYISHRGEI